MKKPNIHSQRSALMCKRLINACIESLIDQGYARTTTVEICARAGVTRGALLHHFRSLPHLLAETLQSIYTGFQSTDQLPDFEHIERERGNLSEMARLILLIWSRVGQREFKAVIELWLAARNDSELAKTLGPVIDGVGATIMTFIEDGAIPVDTGSRSAACFRLAMEAMIGLALGRAISPTDTALSHTDEVLSILIELIDAQHV
jgi:AcrR family transcriptional regulator